MIIFFVMVVVTVSVNGKAVIIDEDDTGQSVATKIAAARGVAEAGPGAGAGAMDLEEGDPDDTDDAGSVGTNDSGASDDGEQRVLQMIDDDGEAAGTPSVTRLFGADTLRRRPELVDMDASFSSFIDYVKLHVRIVPLPSTLSEEALKEMCETPLEQSAPSTLSKKLIADMTAKMRKRMTADLAALGMLAATVSSGELMAYNVATGMFHTCALVV